MQKKSVIFYNFVTLYSVSKLTGLSLTTIQVMFKVIGYKSIGFGR